MIILTADKTAIDPSTLEAIFRLLCKKGYSIEASLLYSITTDYLGLSHDVMQEIVRQIQKADSNFYIERSSHVNGDFNKFGYRIVFDDRKKDEVGSSKDKY